ncbi:MAG: hypothetical protein IKM08_06010 [Clostridia bacterium]|nr:hypothetical protein [Clostridia bacterium]
MNRNDLIRGTIIRTVFVTLELIALVYLSVYSFLYADTGIYGYWGSLLAIFGMLSPIIVYVISSAVFNTANLIMVIKKRHTPESIKKYHKLSRVFLIWGIITGAIYGTVLIPIFLLENIFLLSEYRKETDRIRTEQILLQMQG